MDFAPVIEGFEVVLQPQNFLFCIIGVLVGMVIGVLPGLGPAATIAILLPMTYGMEPVTAIIMLAGIFYGAIYGGTVTAVLLKLPGETSSAITALDGYPMGQKGQAGKALGIGAIASFIGGTIAIIALTFVAPIIAGWALRFGPPEYAALTLLGILLVATISNGTMLKALVAAALGLLFAVVGRDAFTGELRYTAGNLELSDGLQFVPIAMGVFGLAEILYNLEKRHLAQPKPIKVDKVLPNKADLKQSAGPIARGGVLGFFLGILPGGGATVSSMVSYGMEKRLSKDPKRFGKGAIEGVAGPETANNAAATSSFIPLLTLGIPANATMAVMFGALMIQGIAPGPQLVDTNPELFWGVVNSMYIGNLILIILAIPLIGLFVRILYVRSTILAPITLLIVCMGAFTISNRFFEVMVVIVFGVLGYLMKKFGFDPAPLVLAFVLGSLLEDNFRRSLMMFQGDVSRVSERPITLTLLSVFVLVLILPLVFKIVAHRKGADSLLDVVAGETTQQDSSQENTAESRSHHTETEEKDTAATASGEPQKKPPAKPDR
ncbi:tripartite tricarboxylate transporter permease [Nesterenkonia ebinurensis]|uniref:tripartite tricarboxylate transporter permease n=1 Tax=Nesterenkonia ebinurensis TaxID=2608252 RepID=UPI00123E27B9|nr:tripartite tricarboxylate transporter permease [Nesterenkonia ebinurensis]